MTTDNDHVSKTRSCWDRGRRRRGERKGEGVEPSEEALLAHPSEVRTLESIWASFLKLWAAIGVKISNCLCCGRCSEEDLCWEDEELSSLLSKEKESHNPMCESLEQNPYLAGARNDAVDWILKANAYFSFSALTAVLAVNYFDRFFLRFHFQREKPWMSQLAAMACLSLAAKMEETLHPLLSDLQVVEARYVFEAKTIQRMEIQVLSSLQWRMNPVTPLSFVDYILRRLGLMSHPCSEFLIRCESLILCIISDFRFANYLPSVLAAATMLHVINSLEPCFAREYRNQILATSGIDNDKVEECYKQILKSDFCYQARKRELPSIPGSPKGVMDFCFSSDSSSNDSWAVMASVSSSPEPLSKRSEGAPDHQHC